MTDELKTEGETGDEDFDIEVAADADILTDEGTPDGAGEPEVAEYAAPAAGAPLTPEQQRAKFDQTHDINDLPEADRPFFRHYKKSFNKEMERKRQAVKEAAEVRERYEALLAQRSQPEKPADGPPDLGADIDPGFKTALDARVQYEVKKALEASGLTKRLESAEDRAIRIEGENRARDIMSELTTKHGMTAQEQQMIEEWIGDDPNLLVNFQTPAGRARMVKMARVELQEAQAQVNTVKRQANAAGSAISRSGGAPTTPAPTDYRKLREDQGMEAVRDRIVEEDKALWESMR